MMGSRSHPPRLQSGRVVLASILVLDELSEDVCVSVYGEVESVRAVNPRLPDVSCLIVLFCVERRVAQIRGKHLNLFRDFSADRFRQGGICVVKLAEGLYLHRLRLRNLIVSSAVSKGPW